MTSKNIYSMSDEALSLELGQRIERRRLDSRAALTQSQLAKKAGISRSTYQNMIEGKATLVNVIKVLRELEDLEGIESFLPDPGISPVQLLKMRGKVRQRVRATGEKSKSDDEEGLDW
ncbi:helix-turn-helix transcriptional regulator [Marinomonas sp. M1K-6]|uniref:Helix-turn-helix transcriptional regulator n=1 Tax=Marinomonas profundi TaxID=2726122 RepID=A0A847RBY4_9GAMM|nr:helix-turn-helix transcriptional regulator [Marinomonas profundi]NLQ17720.1 helix-turn-helix transcriptional regulator [Marinomonas profundi]UDV04279.1 helix-turn-helix transcriptional regulator [Marinomonas profundi]